jgi:putative ABC transport system permease protein
MDRHFTREIAEVGPRVVWLFPGVVIKDKVGERGARGVELEVEDAQRLAGPAAIRHAAPNIAVWAAIVRGGGRTRLFSAFGVAAESQSIRNLVPEHGRFLSPTDVAGGARVAFLGREVALRLFGRADVVGETIQVDSLRLRVVGVARGKGDQIVNMGGQDDKIVYLPYTTVQRWLQHEQPLQALVLEPISAEASSAAIERAREIIGLHHRFDPHLDTALSFVNIQDVLGIVRSIGRGMRLFMVSAGLLTLAVGGIGVMNIMLVVVAERRREIGLRKAVGATSRAVFVQFLAETLAVCLLAGALGAGLGVAAVQAMAAFIAAHGKGFASPPELSLATAIGVTVVLVATGVVAGVAPALRASRVDPAESLRSA